MAHRVYVDKVEEVAWRRGYLYADDGNRLERTNLPGDDVDDPQTYTGPYDYDAHGNMILMAQLPGGLTWDDDDRLQSTSHIGGGTVYYVYDGAGQRVRKVTVNQSGTTTKQRLYFGSWETYREHKNINTTNDLDLERETLHVHDDHGRVCLLETKTVHSGNPVQTPANVARYQYSLGTANLELDANADVISYEEFHPYGTSSYRADNTAIEVSAKRYRYTGQERDEETGLAYGVDETKSATHRAQEKTNFINNSQSASASDQERLIKQFKHREEQKATETENKYRLERRVLENMNKTIRFQAPLGADDHAGYIRPELKKRGIR